MDDFDRAAAHCRTAHGVREITDACARVIAALYYEGQAGYGYSFVSTGTVPDDPTELYRELFPHDYPLSSPDEKVIADMLGTYLQQHAGRGPVPGWSGLWLP